MKKGAEAPNFNDLQTSVEVCRSKLGAGDESRTRDLNLGKVALYQLSYSRVQLLLPWQSDCHSADPADTLPDHRMLASWSGRRVSNSRPQPWQGCALPTELLPQGPASYRKADYRATSFNYAALCWQFTLSATYLAAFDFVVSSENEIIAKDEPARQQLFAARFIFVPALRLAHRCARESAARPASCNRTSTTA